MKKPSTRQTIKKILVPTDFSPHSERAADYAAMLADGFQAKIDLLHVIEPFPYSVTDTMTVISHGEALKTIASSLLDNARAKLEQNGVTVESHLTQGVPYEKILDWAREKKVDLIVMGTHGRTGVGHLLLGSVADRIVHLAPCPVLTMTAGPKGKKGGKG
jgi:nucleotide-binding universal stress UspA family protein